VATTARTLVLVATELAVAPPREHPVLDNAICPTPPRPLTGPGQDGSRSGEWGPYLVTAAVTRRDATKRVGSDTADDTHASSRTGQLMHPVETGETALGLLMTRDS
jgi:hypothetical protein